MLNFLTAVLDVLILKLPVTLQDKAKALVATISTSFTAYLMLGFTTSQWGGKALIGLAAGIIVGPLVYSARNLNYQPDPARPHAGGDPPEDESGDDEPSV